MKIFSWHWHHQSLPYLFEINQAYGNLDQENYSCSGFHYCMVLFQCKKRKYLFFLVIQFFNHCADRHTTSMFHNQTLFIEIKMLFLAQEPMQEMNDCILII